jgi:POT family proton-dependent oligopeptide transporter
MPTTWLITVDATVSIAGLLASMAFWRLWSKRFKEPSEIIKITLGLAFSAAALLSLTQAALIAVSGHKAHIGWVLAFEVLNSIGFSNMLPVGLALYARASPKPVAGTMLGIYFLHLFMANNLVGWLGGLMERLSGPQFWALHAALVATAGVLTLAAARLFGHLLMPTGAATEPGA